MPDSRIRLTQYSHGAGCGCKIAPSVLETFLKTNYIAPEDSCLLVGNSTKDDAAVYDLGDGTGVISTTDFFMPIVDDPFEFGRVAATNAISDIYAMGGTPMMAIAILGWPVKLLSAEVAQKVIDGGRHACGEAGIHLAGGHSIDSLEPIFGLAVTGRVDLANLKQNSTANAGNLLFLTKPIGVGILTTAEKQGKLKAEHSRLAVESMMKLNTIGAKLAVIDGVTAMTDVTGFGLLGHLLEICQGSDLEASVNLAAVPLLDSSVIDYLEQGCVPGGSTRNWDSISQYILGTDTQSQMLLCDPQTSGGLLVAVGPADADQVSQLLKQAGCYHLPIGELAATNQMPQIKVVE
ncbi:MAG: selenide, water dikinase SelD [Porticoccaceae bacterium]|nr:selenide, water dikinase SelD [Porticoccaceae bacterium]